MQGRGVNNISQLSLFLNSLQTTYVYLRVGLTKNSDMKSMFERL